MNNQSRHFSLWVMEQDPEGKPAWGISAPFTLPYSDRYGSASPCSIPCRTISSVSFLKKSNPGDCCRIFHLQRVIDPPSSWVIDTTRWVQLYPSSIMPQGDLNKRFMFHPPLLRLVPHSFLKKKGFSGILEKKCCIFQSMTRSDAKLKPSIRQVEGRLRFTIDSFV